MTTEVVGTTRVPDGDRHGEIAGVVLRDGTILGKNEAIKMASDLWCRSPHGAHTVSLEAVDLNHDGIPDSVRTVTGRNRVNDLLLLAVYSTTRREWA